MKQISSLRENANEAGKEPESAEGRKESNATVEKKGVGGKSLKDVNEGRNAKKEED